MKRIAVLVSALALAACSGSNGSSSSSGTTGTTTTGTPTSSSGSTGGSNTTSSSSSSSTGSSSGSTTTTTSSSSSSTGGSSGSSGSAYVISGLGADTTVTYDGRDIPHVHCTNFIDCVRVQGYLHAQDRMWEMDVDRHVAEGRIAEMVGFPGLSQDLFYRQMFVTRDGTPIWDALANGLDQPTKDLLQAYADGVNAFIAEAQAGTVQINAEYADMGIAPSAIPQWTIQDSLALGRFFQWSLSETLDQEVNFGQMYAVMSDGELGALVHSRQLDPAYTIPGFPLHTVGAPMQQPVGLAAAMANDVRGLGGIQQQLANIKVKMSKPGFSGSNDWVVDGAHSASGAAMVANDPHLPLLYPSIFWLSHMTADAEGIDLLGSSFPGVPGVLTGRTTHVGWGVTVVGYDVTDLYEETFTDATHVTFNGQPVQVVTVPQTYTIRNLAGGAPVTQTVNLTIVPEHGPIISMSDATHGISVRWTGHEVTSEFRALRNLYVAQGVDDAIAALADWGTGAQNFVLADDQGHIAFDPHALVPARPWAGTVVNGRTLLPWAPLPGDGTAEWGWGDGGIWLDNSQLPQSKDPAQGFLMTANSDPVGVTDDDNVLNDDNYLSFAFDDQTGLRAGRITELLKEKTADGGKVSEADMEEIQADHHAIIGRYIVPIAQNAWNSAMALSDGGVNTDVDPDGGVAAAVALFSGWANDNYECPTGLTDIDPSSAADTDPTVTADSAGCSYFHIFARTLIYDVFNDDSVYYDSALKPDGGADPGFEIDPQLALKGFAYMEDPNTPAAQTTLCDDRGTVGTESCDDMVVRALVEARNILTTHFHSANPLDWKWGQIHTLTFVNPLGAPQIQAFNTDAYARPGGFFTVDVGNPSVLYQNPHDGSANWDFNYDQGGNERWIGLMDGSQTRMQLPGYEVDVPYVGPPTGMLNDWVRNTYFDFPRTQNQVEAAEASQVTFTAQ